MGLKEFITGEKKEEETESSGKFDEPCALCGQGATDVKWAGQYWHKKCKRKAKKMAKGLI